MVRGGGGGYPYIRVLPYEFILKSVVFKFISKEISPTEHEYVNFAFSMNALATGQFEKDRLN